MQKKLINILFLLTMLAFGNSAQAKLFNGEEFYLDNGLRVIVIPNHRAPIVKHMVWYKAGSIDEPLGKGGEAHLLEHLMFRGTRKIKGNRFNEIMEANGAESNAFTSTDMTAYHQGLDISRLELAMFLEADRMQNLEISDKDFALERDIVFQERKQRIDNNPAAYFGEALRRSLWLDHQYARPVTGMPEEILALTKEDVEAFYNKFYAPNNAVLVLSGDIDVKTAKLLAEKYYGKLKRRETPERLEMPKLEESQRSRIEMSRSQIKGVRVSRNFAAPSYKTAPEYIYALSVLSAYMGEGETSKLYKKLVLEDRKALTVGTAYDPAARSYGTFTISAIPQEGVSPEELLEAVDAAWAEALVQLDNAELEKVKQKMLAGLVYLKDNPNDAANIAGSLAVIGMPLQEIEAQEEKIRAVKLADVRKAAQKLTEESAQITGILRPEKKGGR